MAGAGTPTVLLGDRSMIDNNAGKDKSIVNELNFGEKTSKRVTWTAWEFTVLEKGEIEVTNASWGSECGDHSYSVTVEVIDGQPHPTRCGCKADECSEEYDCKHKVPLASIGGSVVLQAALSTETLPWTGKTSLIHGRTRSLVLTVASFKRHRARKTHVRMAILNAMALKETTCPAFSATWMRRVCNGPPP